MQIHGLTPPDLLPPMRQQPAFADIMACLDALQPSTPHAATVNGSDVVWDCAVPRDEIEASLAASTLEVQRHANAVARYLASIVMSDLAWLSDEDDREAVWAAASRRIAERCGRTAMGDITRRWPIVLPPNDDVSQDPPLDLIIKEPALVGDGIGLKTWGTAYTMAQMLPHLAARPSAGLCHLLAHNSVRDSAHDPTQRQRLCLPILELGAGTGLLGLAAAALWRADVVLTDLAAIVPNLAANVTRNTAAVVARGGRARAAVLQWGKDRRDGPDAVDPVLIPRDHLFPLVLAADSLYDDDHPALLSTAIDTHLARDGHVPAPFQQLSPRAVVMVPLRDRTTEKMAAMFIAHMAERSLVPIDEGTIAGSDSDWGAGAGASCKFTCSWWVFRRVLCGKDGGNDSK